MAPTERENNQLRERERERETEMFELWSEGEGMMMKFLEAMTATNIDVTRQ
ncbi:conserved hypothetical protein [Ricinus communis]|uniref:Uncharacterized protein n=1 Tax=Ricinus communis TaxID=3988 RepID=B9SY57_RICCO|nr:conserved hypothetical protein [Ricinus communis]